VEGLAAALDAAEPGRYLVRYGAKFVSPTIEEGMAALADAGVGRVVGIVLTPHRSTLGSGEYFRRAAEAAARAAPPVEVVPVPSWHRAPGLAELLAARVEAALAWIDGTARRRTAVFFTPHSLPERAVAGDDPYPAQVAESAADVAGLLGLDAVDDLSWGVAWQSAGRTEEPWIGPDLLSEIRRVAGEGATSVMVCPVGFVSDHLEVLYDLDIEALRLADSLGVALARTPSLNDDPRFLDVLVAVVCQAAGADQTGRAPAASGTPPA
jgi:ferrochelatase